MYEVQGLLGLSKSTTGDDRELGTDVAGGCVPSPFGLPLSYGFQGAVTEVANRMGGLPDKLIVYRDGVSEGEYWKVMDAEVGAIKGTLY